MSRNQCRGRGRGFEDVPSDEGGIRGDRGIPRLRPEIHPSTLLRKGDEFANSSGSNNCGSFNGIGDGAVLWERPRHASQSGSRAKRVTLQEISIVGISGLVGNGWYRAWHCRSRGMAIRPPSHLSFPLTYESRISRCPLGESSRPVSAVDRISGMSDPSHRRSNRCGHNLPKFIDLSARIMSGAI